MPVPGQSVGARGCDALGWLWRSGPVEDRIAPYLSVRAKINLGRPAQWAPPEAALAEFARNCRSDLNQNYTLPCYLDLIEPN